MDPVCFLRMCETLLGVLYSVLVSAMQEALAVERPSKTLDRFERVKQVRDKRFCAPLVLTRASFLGVSAPTA